MELNPVQFNLPPIDTPLLKGGVEYSEGKGESSMAGDFSKVLSTAISNLKQAHNAAAQGMKDYAAGKDIEISDVMITLEKAQYATDLAIQIRNRLVDGYNELIRMQI